MTITGKVGKREARSVFNVHIKSSVSWPMLYMYKTKPIPLCTCIKRISFRFLRSRFSFSCACCLALNFNITLLIFGCFAGIPNLLFLCMNVRVCVCVCVSLSLSFHLRVLFVHSFLAHVFLWSFIAGNRAVVAAVFSYTIRFSSFK